MPLPVPSRAADPTAPILLFIVGPPAVGKMTVGAAIARRTGLRLFHNHIAIEPALRFFEFGTPSFNRIVREFRLGVLEEVAASDLPGLVFTYAWAFGEPGEEEAVAAYSAPFHARGSRILFLELTASEETRLIRNRTEFRLTEKASKRDLPWSDGNLREMGDKYRMNSVDEFAGRDDHLLVDNGALEPDVVAEKAIIRFALPRLGDDPLQEVRNR